MKKVMIVKAHEVEMKPFNIEDFMYIKVTKKALRTLADNLGLIYDEKQIAFTKKLMAAYLKDRIV